MVHINSPHAELAARCLFYRICNCLILDSVFVYRVYLTHLYFSLYSLSEYVAMLVLVPVVGRNWIASQFTSVSFLLLLDLKWLSHVISVYSCVYSDFVNRIIIELGEWWVIVKGEWVDRNGFKLILKLIRILERFPAFVYQLFNCAKGFWIQSSTKRKLSGFCRCWIWTFFFEPGKDDAKFKPVKRHLLHFFSLTLNWMTALIGENDFHKS